MPRTAAARRKTRLFPGVAEPGPRVGIRGDSDRYGTRRQVAIAKERRRCPLETLIMAERGHVPHREKPEETLDAIASFYDEVRKAG